MARARSKKGSISLGALSAEAWALGAFIVVTGLVLAFGQIAEEVLEGDSTEFDRTILLALRNPQNLADPLGPPWLEEAARDITSLGSYAVLTVLVSAVAGFLVAIRHRAEAVWILASVTGGVALNNILKLVIDRPRPELVPHAVRVFTASFPSGHATLAAVVYLTLGAQLAGAYTSRGVKLYLVLLAIGLTVAVGLSRIYLGVHYPTDVLAGWCVGAAWAIASWSVWSRPNRAVQ